MFATVVDNFMRLQNERLFAAVPSALHLVSEHEVLNKEYYLRHRIETVKRIWMTSQTDALALAEMVDEDYDSARKWSKYLTQELNHDLLYLNDLSKHGYGVDKVALVPPFASTLAMVEYLKEAIKRYGSMPAVAYSVWVEWNSDKASAIVVKKAKHVFSSEHVKGASAHTRIDINEDHYQIMLQIIERLIARGKSEDDFFMVMSSITDFIASYFTELDQATLTQKSGSLKKEVYF